MTTFLKRTFSSILLLTVFGLIVFGNTTWSVGLFCATAIVLSYFSSLELCRLFRASGIGAYAHHTALFTSLIVGVMSCNIFIPAAGMKLQPAVPVFMAVLLPLFCLSLWLKILFSHNNKEVLMNVTGSAAALLLLAIPFACLLQCVRPDARISCSNPMLILLYLVLVTKIGDIGAYVVGSLSGNLLPGGNHKMIPSISPGKSWEGAAGGLLATIGLSLWLYPLVFGATTGPALLKPVLLGVVLYFGGASGDLAESVLKRIAGIKDSGRFFPGIGGVLDLVDSLMLNSIIFYFFLEI